MNRPYRQAWSRDEAEAYIRALSGTHFDPAIVHNFLEFISTYKG